MNTGLVSSRYALALLKYVSGTEDEEKVYSQVLRLSGSLSAVPSGAFSCKKRPYAGRIFA